MKKSFEIIIISIVFILITTLYFEFVVNREINNLLQTLLMIVMVVLAIIYFVYLIKQLLKILKI